VPPQIDNLVAETKAKITLLIVADGRFARHPVLARDRDHPHVSGIRARSPSHFQLAEKGSV